MKNIREKFKKNVNFVKPLYKKLRNNKVTYKNDEFNSIKVDKTLKLCGDGINVKRKIVSKSGNFGVNKNQTNLKDSRNGSRTLDSNFILKKLKLRRSTDVNRNKEKTRVLKDSNMLGIVESQKGFNIEDENADGNHVVIHEVPDSWLRVYPAAKRPREPVSSIFFRCLVSQLGLFSFLVLWTLLWVMVIHFIEGPNEIEVSENFKKQQNQLIIDLATELRQITPISPKWREAIEARINDERTLTILAVSRGARLHPGFFWDISGTFLFGIYVMTALGFGAPVPQTLYGRTSTLVYAILAVPLHIYLMVNASTCVVIFVEKFIRRIKMCLREKIPFVVRRTAFNMNSASPTHSRRVNLKKSRSKLRKWLLCIFKVVCVGRCVPLATLLYYIAGAIIFGVCRNKSALDTLMFPLEFTTTGGLEHVESHVRVTYGIYVEGAMTLIACALATLRRHSGAAVSSMSHNYRLFQSEPCKDCLHSAS